MLVNVTLSNVNATSLLLCHMRDSPSFWQILILRPHPQKHVTSAFHERHRRGGVFYRDKF